MPVASKIEEFLRDAPPGRLHVVVGYADVTGLAWLGRHAAERPVTLLIGDTRRRLFQGQPQDRRAALDLLARGDVEVLSGYRRGAPFVHQKVYVVASPDGDEAVAGVVGSANLTDAGLFRNEETVVTVAGAELPAVWQQTRVICARGRPAGERIAGYIRDASGERLQAPAEAAGRRNDSVGRASERRPVPSGGGGGGRPPTQRTGGGSGSRRSARSEIGGALLWFGVALIGLLLLVGLCSVTRDRRESGATSAAPARSPSATSPEPQEAPQPPAAAPQPPADESDPQLIPPTTVPESERSIEEPERGDGAVAAADGAIPDTAPAGEEVLGDARVGELDDAAAAALSVVVAAARSVSEAEGGFAGASAAALGGMGLTIPAPSELAKATGEEGVTLMFSDQAAGRTPWEVSVLAPNPSDGGALAVWAVAVRSPVACRAVVLDPDLGSWASTTGTVGYSPCGANVARNSYLERRGVGGERAYFHWTPATPDRTTGDEPPADKAS